MPYAAADALSTPCRGTFQLAVAAEQIRCRHSRWLRSIALCVQRLFHTANNNKMEKTNTHILVATIPLTHIIHHQIWHAMHRATVNKRHTYTLIHTWQRSFHRRCRAMPVVAWSMPMMFRCIISLAVYLIYCSSHSSFVFCLFMHFFSFQFW